MPADNMPQRRLRRYVILLQLFWAVIIGLSLYGNFLSVEQEVEALAAIEARTSLEKDLVYRRWAARHGGIYVPITAETPANPLLADVPERDITTPAGRRLTLMNPASMTRQVHEMGKAEYGARGHITSLRPLSPGNAPDAWERQALEAFARGDEQDVMAVVALDGVPHLRMMRRLLVEEGCLKCHAAQGYEEGEIRGGLSTAVPLVPYYAALAGHQRNVMLAHALIWLVGASVFLFGFNRFRHGLVEQQHTMRALEQAALEWSAAMNASDDSVYLLGLDRRILRANLAFGRLVGQEPAALIGRDIETIVHPEGEKTACPVCQAQKELRDAVITMEADHPANPAGRPIEITLKLVRDAGGQPLSILMTLHDLSHSREQLEEKAQLEIRLRQAQKMEAIGTLAGGIAHDFNNILSPILGYTEIALHQLPTDTPVAPDLKQVLVAAKRAKELVQQILTFSRQGEQELKPLRLQFVVKESLKFLRASLPTTIIIREKVDGECEAVLADPTQIQQVVMNLCTNAYHAMREQGGMLTVGLRMVTLGEADMPAKTLSEPGRYVQLSVADTGSGIPRQMLERIFEPYFTTKQQGEGTGLGLAMVHGIVKGLQGAVTVYSEPGKGTEFHVYLPTLAAEPDEAVGVSMPLPSGNERILLVDDDAMILTVVRELLGSLGYRVEGFADAGEALAAFQDRPRDFDLVITDMTMPKMTGETLVREMLAVRSELPVILCTGFSENMGPEKAQSMGIRQFLMKPVVFTELARAVRAVLDEEAQG